MIPFRVLLQDLISQMLCGTQSREHEVVKLGPISMGERLRIGGDVSSDDDMDEPTPSPPPSSPKRSHKRRVLPPRSIDSSKSLKSVKPEASFF